MEYIKSNHKLYTEMHKDHYPPDESALVNRSSLKGSPTNKAQHNVCALHLSTYQTFRFIHLNAVI